MGEGEGRDGCKDDLNWYGELGSFRVYFSFLKLALLGIRSVGYTVIGPFRCTMSFN